MNEKSGNSAQAKSWENTPEKKTEEEKKRSRKREDEML